MMTNHRSLLTLTVAGLLAATTSLRAADDATPPGAPPPPPPGAPGGGRGAGGPGGRMDPAARIQEMKDKLALTEDQVTKVKAVFEKYRPQMEALRADTALSQEDRRTKSQELRKAQQTDIEALLTAEQKPKYQELVASQRRGGPGGGPGGPGGGPGGPGGGAGGAGGKKGGGQ